MRFRLSRRTSGTEAGQPEGQPDPAGGGPATRSGAEVSDDVPEHELIADSAAPPPVIVPRWVQLVLLPIALLGLWALARASGPVLLILIVAGMVALILNPLVKL